MSTVKWERKFISTLCESSKQLKYKKIYTKSIVKSSQSLSRARRVLFSWIQLWRNKKQSLTIFFSSSHVFELMKRVIFSWKTWIFMQHRKKTQKKSKNSWTTKKIFSRKKKQWKQHFFWVSCRFLQCFSSVILCDLKISKHRERRKISSVSILVF